MGYDTLRGRPEFYRIRHTLRGRPEFYGIHNTIMWHCVLQPSKGQSETETPTIKTIGTPQAKVKRRNNSVRLK